MSAVRQASAIGRFAARSLRSSLALTLASVVALGTLVGLWVGLPLYAESASARLLATEVDEAAADGVPFGYLFSYNRLSGGNKAWADFAELNALLDGDESPFATSVRLTQRVFTTVPFDLVDEVNGDERVENQAIASASFASMTGFDDLADFTEGRAAQSAVDAGGPVEVVIDEAYAAETDLSVGQRLTILNRRADAGDPNRSLDIHIVGIWRPPGEQGDAPADPESRFLRTGVLARALVVPESTIVSVIDPLGDATISNGQWLALLDSSTTSTDSIDALLADTERINRQVDQRLTGARLLVSPETSLEGFQDDVARVNRGLQLFSLPTIALTIAVAALLLSLRWRSRLGDVVMLRRRGVSAGQLIASNALEAIVMALAAAAVGLGLARVIAGFIGRTTTFLRLEDRTDLGLLMNSRSWSALVTATMLASLLALAPSLSLLGSSISTGRSRDVTSRPWWQRSKLDLVLVCVVGLFAWFLLDRVQPSGRLLDDPVVILLPAMSALAVGLLVLRLVPWLAGRLGAALERTDSTAALLVARRAERSPAGLTAPLLLLVITAAVAVYTGSLARTLDLQLFDTAHHTVGAAHSARSDEGQQFSVRFEIVDDRPVPAGVSGPAIDPLAFERIWGVEGASRIARTPARLTPPTEAMERVTFFGVDTATFAEVAFWRDDYSSQSLPELMAQLDATPDGVLVHSAFMRRGALALGDLVELGIRIDGRVVGIDMVVVGSFDQFPTWIPGQEEPPVVASLSSFEARSPDPVPTELLFVETTAADVAQTRADLNRVGITSAQPRSASDLVERAQSRPDRQGVFGLLTVGFVLSAALTVVGFVFYALFGFTRQATELGVLRAFGLRTSSLSMLVALDLLLVGVVGVGLGAATGLVMARLYLPRLLANPTGSAPEMLAELDWGAAVVISLVLLVALAAVTAVLLSVLRGLKLFTAVRFDQGAGG